MGEAKGTGMLKSFHTRASLRINAANMRTGDPQYHLDIGVHCSKPEREDWELHKCILRLWSLFASWVYKRLDCCWLGAGELWACMAFDFRRLDFDRMKNGLIYPWSSSIDLVVPFPRSGLAPNEVMFLWPWSSTKAPPPRGLGSRFSFLTTFC